MKENTSTVTEDDIQVSEAGSGDVLEKSGGNGQKLFTQEEVNSFVQSRLSRYKAQADRENQESYSRKMQELQQREMKLLVKEQLSARGMSGELADIITCTDENDLKRKLDTLQKVYGGSAAGKKEESTGFQIGAYRNGEPVSGPDPIRKAMGLGKD